MIEGIVHVAEANISSLLFSVPQFRWRLPRGMAACRMEDKEGGSRKTDGGRPAVPVWFERERFLVASRRAVMRAARATMRIVRLPKRMNGVAPRVPCMVVASSPRV